MNSTMVFFHPLFKIQNIDAKYSFPSFSWKQLLHLFLEKISIERFDSCSLTRDTFTPIAGKHLSNNIYHSPSEFQRHLERHSYLTKTLSGTGRWALSWCTIIAKTNKMLGNRKRENGRFKPRTILYSRNRPITKENPRRLCTQAIAQTCLQRA